MRIHSVPSGNAKQAFGFLVMGTQKRQAYEVTFTQPKLGLNIDDKDGGVCVMRASGENADVIGRGDEITSFNGKTLLSLGITTHTDLAKTLASYPHRPVKMGLLRTVESATRMLAIQREVHEKVRITHSLP